MQKKIRKYSKVFFAVAVLVGSFLAVPVFAEVSKWSAPQYQMNEMTEGIVASDVTITDVVDENGNPSKHYEITYTIPEGFDQERITLVPDGYIRDAALPGMNDSFIIHIRNESSHEYAYVDDSFVLSVEDFSIYDESVLGDIVSSATSFSGVPIREEISFYRTKNTALQALFGVDRTSDLTSEMVQDDSISAQLDPVKYPNGVADLNLYYLDFYNAKYGTNATKLEDLPDEAISELLDGNYTQSARESNREVIELAFNYLYNKLVAFSFGQEEINDENSQNYSIGSYMRKESSYQYANRLLQDSFAKLESGEEASINMPHIYINGRYTTNTYMNYYIGFYLELQLERTDMPVSGEVEVPTPPKTDYVP